MQNALKEGPPPEAPEKLEPMKLPTGSFRDLAIEKAE
jgi:hypothetical protein